MFVENFTKFIKYYGKGRKFKLFGFFLFSLISGFLEFIGIALVYPFILLIVRPASVMHSPYYISFAAFTHTHNFMTNAFILGFIVTLLFVVKNVFMIFNFYLQNSFVNNWKLALNKKFMHYYLFSPYKDSMKSSPSEKIYNMTFLTAQSLDGFIFRVINLVTNSVVVIMILILLFVKFAFAAFVTGIFVVFSMMSQNKFFKEKIRNIALKFSRSTILSNEKTLENINNLKEIKILSAEEYFYDEYVKAQKDFTKVLIENNFYGGIPPYVIEILAVASLFVMAGLISLQNIDYADWMVASYAVIVAAIFRIAPALNKIQSSINIINTSRDFVKSMLIEYERSDLDVEETKSDFRVNFRNNIRLENVYFSYTSQPVIKGLNLEIRKGEFVGIIGVSGAGKSTLADIIMGLLPLDSGKISIDDIELNQKNFYSLRKVIGYVPQQISVLDGSFKRNVAWGIAEEEINEDRVVEAMKQAQIYDFVEKSENGINTKMMLGSTGLSQGQKQRLAIARALYKDPEILIFDEATSSLDVETEHEITKMLSGFKGEKTIIAIAHRLSTLKSCDRLIYLKDGEIVDTGSFDELSCRHADFEKLVRLSSLGINVG